MRGECSCSSMAKGNLSGLKTLACAVLQSVANSSNEQGQEGAGPGMSRDRNDQGQELPGAGMARQE